MNTNPTYQDPVWEELIDGKIVAMSPRPDVYHNSVAENIDFIFRTYLKGKQCIPLGDGYDVHLTKKDCFIPDFMIVCDRSKIKADGVHGAPDLVVEVLSPSTAKNDRGYKKDIYAKCSVKEYWIVNPIDKSIEQYFLQDGDFILQEVYTYYSDGIIDLMKPEERAAVIKEFKCGLYDDLLIPLEDVFANMLT